MMTAREIDMLVEDYVGTSSGYLNGFSYSIHEAFYQAYCDIEIDVAAYRARGLTTRGAFIEILREAKPKDQAKIIRGVFEMVPPPEKVTDVAARKRRTLYKELLAVAARLGTEGQAETSMVAENRVARRYYSSRNRTEGLTLVDLYGKLQHLYLLFRDRDYFKERAGITAHDLPEVIKHEAGIALSFQPFPITTWSGLDLTEDNVFDAIEFLYDHVSKPGKWMAVGDESGYEYSDYDGYDDKAGRAEFRQRTNAFLADYRSGYELTEQGDILALGAHGLQHILSAEIVPYDEANVDGKVRNAIAKWRNRHLSLSDKREAIRELADVFEWLKKTRSLSAVLEGKDESAIFNLANSFAIRHHDPNQKTNYDKAIWYSWIFHFYLATHHAAIRLLIKHEKSKESSTPRS